jgi:ribonuclease PH
MAQTEEYRRNDGRGATTMRKLGIEIGGLSKSDGSSRFGFGEHDKYVMCGLTTTDLGFWDYD